LFYEEGKEKSLARKYNGIICQLNGDLAVIEDIAKEQPLETKLHNRLINFNKLPVK
jgi:hypothetical protein